MTFGSSWRVRLTVLALSVSVGFLLTNTLNALNVQVRPLSPTIVMTASDLSVPTTNTNSSTVDKTFSEQAPRNPSANTILRCLILPRASIKSNCSNVIGSMQDDSISYAMPQRAWMHNFPPEALPVTTVRIDLKTSQISGNANDLYANASIIADLLGSVVSTNSTYAPFDAVTPFKLVNFPPNNRVWYPRDSQGMLTIPSARLAGLLPPDPQSSEHQDREWLLAHTTEYLQRATADDWQNSSVLLQWTVDISRVNITPTMWVDAVTIESKVRSRDASVGGAGPGNFFGTTTAVQMVEANTRYGDTQVHGYAICSSMEGAETLYARVRDGDPAFTSQSVCESRSNTSMYVFSSGRHYVADGLEYESKPAEKTPTVHVRNLSTVYSTTFARISWQPQNLSTAYNATCDASDGCMGLDAELSDTNQRLLVSTNAMPLDELATLKTYQYAVNGSKHAPQQPLQLVLVRRPTEVKGHVTIPDAPFRAKYKDATSIPWRGTRANNYLGDPVLPHNIKRHSTGNESEWDSLQHEYCSAIYDRRILNYVNNHLYMETTLQPTYTAAAFFLFQNGMARDVLPRDSAAMSAIAVPLQLDGNIQEMSVWLSVPKLNAMLTLAGCAVLVVALLLALVRLRVMTATHGYRVAVTAPHQIARVMVDDTTFPSLLLKRHVHGHGVTGDAGTFHIHDVTVRSINDKKYTGGC